MTLHDVDQPPKALYEMWRAMYIRNEPADSLPDRAIRDWEFDLATWVTEHRVEQAREQWRGMTRFEWLTLPEDLQDAHHRMGEFSGPQPRTPNQLDGRERCQQNDHSWMNDERFEGHSYSVKEWTTMSGPTVLMRSEKKCFFCGFVAAIA